MKPHLYRAVWLGRHSGIRPRLGLVGTSAGSQITIVLLWSLLVVGHRKTRRWLPQDLKLLPVQAPKRVKQI
jgi:hypothetical protein